MTRAEGRTKVPANRRGTGAGKRRWCIWVGVPSPNPRCVHVHAGAGHSHSHDGHGHSHGPGHSHAPASFDKAFAIGISLNATFVLVEALYGYRANSLALVADAGHNLGDVLG